MNNCQTDAHLSSETTYKDAGVDINEGARAIDAIKDAVRQTYTPEVIGDLGGFGGLFSAASFKDMQDPVLVSGTDGVGTKLELAKRLHKHDSIGIDLVAMCVNDIATTGARPLFFLDYLAIGKLDAKFAAEVVGGIAKGCKQAGCALIGGEMAEHPGVMQPESYDISGFAVGVVDKPQMIGPERVCVGDKIIGIASSGLHSNGYSLVRHALTNAMSDAQLAAGQLNDGTSLAKALLAPTRIYARPLLDALNFFNAQKNPAQLQLKPAIHAAAHITGGGITENLNRALPAGMNALLNKKWHVPPVINAVVNAAGLSEEEALKTFNMGIGLALLVDAQAASDVCEFFAAIYGKDDVFTIGEVVAAKSSESEPVVLYAD